MDPFGSDQRELRSLARRPAVYCGHSHLFLSQQILSPAPNKILVCRAALTSDLARDSALVPLRQKPQICEHAQLSSP